MAVTIINILTEKKNTSMDILNCWQYSQQVPQEFWIFQVSGVMTPAIFAENVVQEPSWAAAAVAAAQQDIRSRQRDTQW